MQSKRLLNLLSQYGVNVDYVLSNEILMHYNDIKYSIYYSITDKTYCLYYGNEIVIEHLPYTKFKVTMENFLINF